MRILGYIPARLGSVRVRAKNLRLLHGRPMLSYGIRAVTGVREAESFVVNTESEAIAAVARENGMGVYMRDAALASDQARTDPIVVDFLRANPCDAVAVVNPTAPFLRPATVDAALRRFRDSGCQTLFSVNTVRRHAFMCDAALNFDPAGPSPRTQDLRPITFVNFIICVFDAAFALAEYERHGRFLYAGRAEHFEMPEEESHDIDTEFDFRIAELMLSQQPAETRYHPAMDLEA